jgi:hypothetical protein
MGKIPKTKTSQMGMLPLSSSGLQRPAILLTSHHHQPRLRTSKHTCTSLETVRDCIEAQRIVCRKASCYVVMHLTQYFSSTHMVSLSEPPAHPCTRGPWRRQSNRPYQLASDTTRGVDPALTSAHLCTVIVPYSTPLGPQQQRPQHPEKRPMRRDNAHTNTHGR